MALISSRENRLVKEYIGLRENKSRRKETEAFVIEGARLAKDAVLSNAEILTAFITEDARVHFADICKMIDGKADSVYEVTPAVAKSLADTKSAQGVFCIVKTCVKENGQLNPKGAYLALENIQDPGNLGTILRTSEAMGLDAVILSDGCVDVYSPKVVRASMGAVFRLNVVSEVFLPDELAKLRSKGIKTYAAVAGGEALNILKTDLSGGVAAVIGNEGSGLTQECIDACDSSITIHMRGRAESLNAAAAANIIIWEISKHREE